VGSLPHFLEHFVAPLHAGGVVRVGNPLTLRDRHRFALDGGLLHERELMRHRLTRALRLIAEPPLVEPDLHDLSLWMGLHNLLFFDHPEADYVWARGHKWSALEAETRQLFEWSRPLEVGDALSRHIAIEALLGLQRDDTIVAAVEGELRFPGRAPPPRLHWWVTMRAAPRVERVLWAAQPHAPAVARLFSAVLAISPLTALLYPQFAPRQWAPTSAAAFLRQRPLARAVCYAWAGHSDWYAPGARVTAALLNSLGVRLERPLGSGERGRSEGHGRPEPVRVRAPSASSSGPPIERATRGDQVRRLEHGEGPSIALPVGANEVGLVVGALLHLHVIEAVELQARVTPALVTRDDAHASFLALPLALEALTPILGDPFAGVTDPKLRERWSEWCQQLAGLIPRRIVEGPIAALVARITESHPT